MQFIVIIYGTFLSIKKLSNKLFNFIGKRNVCSICGQVYTKPASIDCGHVFCNECIVKYHKENSKCPVCGSDIKKVTLLYGLSEIQSNVTSSDHAKVLLMSQKKVECIKELKQTEVLLEKHGKTLELIRLKYEETIQELQRLDAQYEYRKQQAHSAYKELEVINIEIEQIEANLRLMKHISND